MKKDRVSVLPKTAANGLNLHFANHYFGNAGTYRFRTVGTKRACIADGRVPSAKARAPVAARPAALGSYRVIRELNESKGGEL